MSKWIALNGSSKAMQMKAFTVAPFDINRQPWKLKLENFLLFFPQLLIINVQRHKK